MGDFSVPLLARVIAKDFAGASGLALSGGALQDLAHRIETGMRTAVHQQRELLVAQCDARVELWRRSEERAGAPESLRAEARARANEAAYLADVVRSSG